MSTQAVTSTNKLQERSASHEQDEYASGQILGIPPALLLDNADPTPCQLGLCLVDKTVQVILDGSHHSWFETPFPILNFILATKGLL